MFESSPDCVKLLDLAGNVLEMNANGQCAMEIDDLARIRGMRWADLWPVESRASVEEAVRLARDQRLGRFATFCPTAKGTPKWWDVTVTPVLDLDGQLTHLLSVSRDVTALVSAEQQAQELAARMRFALDAAQIGEWELDVRSGQARCSLRHNECFGYSQGLPQWTLEMFRQHLHPEDRGWVMEAVQATVQGSADCRFECRVVWPDESIHWIAVRGSLDARGERMLGVVLDVTDRRLAEFVAEGQRRALELAVAGEPLEVVFEVLALAAERGSTSGALASVMKADGQGQLRQLASPSLPQAFRPAIETVPIGPAVGSCGTAAFLRQPVIVADIEEDPRWAEVREQARASGLRACWSQPILGSLGQVLGTVASYHRRPHVPDERERESMALLANTAAMILERHAAESDLREADRRKTEFLATLAHELRNPLAPIRNALEIMARRADDPAVVDRARSLMSRQVDHMVRLVDDLLDVARISSGKLALRFEQVAIGQVVSAAVDATAPLLEAKGHRLELSVHDRALQIRADPTRLTQVLSNLLNNGAKYTAAGGHLSLRVGRQDGWVRIDVCDDGAGLSRHSLETIFEMFAQLEPQLDRAQGGLGIGLSLARRLVVMHGGELLAQSPGLGLGSTFSVLLPVAC
jgi:PAS domain S-box-containing protein